MSNGYGSKNELRNFSYHYQAPKPTADLLADFWALEQEAVSLLKSLEN